MAIWFTSDLHFGHEAVIDYCKRPFVDAYAMNRIIIHNYNECVKDDDTVYFLGDLTLRPHREVAPLLAELKGKKVLVRGNHDHFSIGQYNKLGFVVYEEMLLRLFGHTLRLSHFPRRPPFWARLFKPKAHFRYLDRRPKKDGRWLLHGHTHSSEQFNARRKTIHVGVDAWDFKPVSMRQIESIISTHS